MTYEEILKNTLWIEKRNEILKRDNYCCQECRNKNFFNEAEIETGTISDFKYLQDYTDKEMPDIERYIYEVTFSSEKYSNCKGLIFSSSFIDEFRSSDRYILYGTDKQEKFKSRHITSDFFLAALKGELKGKTKSSQDFFVHGVKNDSFGIWVYMKGLHIHHRFYQNGKEPWEYPNVALITLC